MKAELIQIYIIVDIAEKIQDNLNDMQKEQITTARDNLKLFVEDYLKGMKIEEVKETIQIAKDYVWARREDIEDLTEYALEGCNDCKTNKRVCGKRKLFTRLNIPNNGAEGCGYK